MLDVTGLDELSPLDLLDAYPNPASAITCIPVSAAKEMEGTITLRDVSGKLIETIHEGSIPAGESKYFLFANEYAAGSYMIVIETSSSRLTKKLMIK